MRIFFDFGLLRAPQPEIRDTEEGAEEGAGDEMLAALFFGGARGQMTEHKKGVVKALIETIKMHREEEIVGKKMTKLMTLESHLKTFEPDFDAKLGFLEK